MKPLYHLTFIGGNMPTHNKALFNSAAAALHTYEALRAAGGPLPIISRGDVIVTIPDLKTEAFNELTSGCSVGLVVSEHVNDNDYYPVPISECPLKQARQQMAEIDSELQGLAERHNAQMCFTAEQEVRWTNLQYAKGRLHTMIHKLERQEQAA